MNWKYQLCLALYSLITHVQSKDVPATTTSGERAQQKANTGTPAKTTTGKSSSSSSSSSSPSSSSKATITSSATGTYVHYPSFPNIHLTASNGNVAYAAHAKLGGVNNGQLFTLVLDLIQPEVWVMNADSFYDCDYLSNWWQSEESIYSTYSDAPRSVTTKAEYTAAVCAMGGRYVVSDALVSGSTSITTRSLPHATVTGLANGNSYTIPVANGDQVNGNWETDQFSLNDTEGDTFILNNFTFLNTYNTYRYYGSLGLAGKPKGSGFLYELYNQGVIASPGYSLWFGNSNSSDPNYGLLMPGMVDQSYYDGPLYSFNMLPHLGSPFYNVPSIVEGLNEIQFPTLLLDDISIENTGTGDQVSLKNNDSSIPVFLDSRSATSYLPIEIVIALAVQINAFYSEDINSWLVECDKINSAPATINFKFNDLTIEIDVSKFVGNLNYEGSSIKFPSGSEACLLYFMPNTYSGYNALGTPFISSVFLAVDNEGGNVAIAKPNSLIVLNDDASSQTYVKTITSSSEAKQYPSSIGYIQSGSIPFATTKTIDDVTLSLTSVSIQFSDASTDVPARFYGYISDGVFVTHESSNVTTTLPGGAASAAKAGTTRAQSGGNSIHNPFAVHNDLTLSLYSLIISMMALLIGVCVL